MRAWITRASGFGCHRIAGINRWGRRRMSGGLGQIRSVMARRGGEGRSAESGLYLRVAVAPQGNIVRHHTVGAEESNAGVDRAARCASSSGVVGPLAFRRRSINARLGSGVGRLEENQAFLFCACFSARLRACRSFSRCLSRSRWCRIGSTSSMLPRPAATIAIML